MFIKYINTTAYFWKKNENIGTADPHLRSPKSPTGAKSKPKWSIENRGSTTEPRERRRGQEKGSISRDSVDSLQWI